MEGAASSEANDPTAFDGANAEGRAAAAKGGQTS